MTAAKNYDRDSLAVYVDNRPWIIGETTLGEHRLNDQPLSGEPADWVAVRDPLTSLRFSSTIDLTNGASTPVAGALSLALHDVDLAANLRGAPISVRYDDGVLWLGTVRSFSASVSPDYREPDRKVTNVSIVASEWPETLSRTSMATYTRIYSTVAGDVLGAFLGDLFGDITNRILPNRWMPALTEPYGGTLLDLVSDCLTLGQAFVRLDTDDDGATHPMVELLYADGTPDYELGPSDLLGIDLASGVDDAVSTVTITLKHDDGSGANATHTISGTKYRNAVGVTLDALPEALTQIAATWPMPLGEDVRAASADLDLTSDDPHRFIRVGDIVTVSTDGTTTYTGTVLAVEHTIDPTTWSMKLTLGPGNLRPSAANPIPPAVTAGTQPGQHLPAGNSAAYWTPVPTAEWSYARGGTGWASSYWVYRFPGTVTTPDRSDPSAVLVDVLNLTDSSITESGLTAGDYTYTVYTFAGDDFFSAPFIYTVTVT